MYILLYKRVCMKTRTNSFVVRNHLLTTNIYFVKCQLKPTLMIKDEDLLFFYNIQFKLRFENHLKWSFLYVIVKMQAVETIGK